MPESSISCVTERAHQTQVINEFLPRLCSKRCVVYDHPLNQAAWVAAVVKVRTFITVMFLFVSCKSDLLLERIIFGSRTLSVRSWYLLLQYLLEFFIFTDRGWYNSNIHIFVAFVPNYVFLFPLIIFLAILEHLDDWSLSSHYFYRGRKMADFRDLRLFIWFVSIIKDPRWKRNAGWIEIFALNSFILPLDWDVLVDIACWHTQRFRRVHS